MDFDREFFGIVAQLGPMGDIKLRSFHSHPSTGKGFDPRCGCGSDSSTGCCRSTDDGALPA